MYWLLICLLLVACASSPQLPVEAQFNGEPVLTTVDSEIARFYLQSYHSQQSHSHSFYQTIDSLKQTFANRLPSREQLARISHKYSVDLATLLLADSLLQHGCNRVLNQAFSSYLANQTQVDRQLASNYLVLFVPGWNYVETGNLTGANFAQPRQLASANNLENTLVSVPSMGAVEENAAVVAQAIRRHANSGKQIILVGASSAGPAIYLALGQLLTPQERQVVKAWLNLGGILRGSPLVDVMQRFPRRLVFNIAIWLEQLNKHALISMSAEVSRQRFAQIAPFSDVLIINYLGVPLSGQLSRFSTKRYPLLKSQGPNDGLTLLIDAIAPNSHTIVAFGSDHYLAEDPQINRKSIALMRLIIDMLEQDIRCESDVETP